MPRKRHGCRRRGNLDFEIMIMDEALALGDMAFQGKCINKTGSYHKYEGIYDAFDFVIENKKPLRLNREWRSDIFGNVVFPMIEAKN